MYSGGSVVAVDKDRVYWHNGSDLKTMCKDGSGLQVLATTTVNALAVDSTGIYWAGGDSIWKIAK